MSLYFIRHGQSQANVDQVYAGQRYDSPLTIKGINQARNATEDLAGLKIARIISSKLMRAAKTAEILAKYQGVKVEYDPRILEYDMGDASGSPLNKDINLKEINNIEDIGDFYSRVKSFIDEYIDSEQNILIVSHGGVGRMIKTILNNTDPELFYHNEQHPNAKIIKISKN